MPESQYCRRSSNSDNRDSAQGATRRCTNRFVCTNRSPNVGKWAERNQISQRHPPNGVTGRYTVAPMGSQQSRPQTPEIQFRVLIIGRANAGKTAILQRVCETTDSPIVYRGKEEVRRPTILSANLVSFPTQVKLDPSMGVSDRGTSH